MTQISIRGISLNVKVIGHGYPLLLMHGGPGLDYQTLLPLQPLADQFTLVFYDHRCNGRSEGAEVSTMTWENLTADADALREKLGYDQWAVLGHSFGYSQLLKGWTVMDRLGEIQAPTLILAGRYDFLFPTEHQVALAAGIPNARLEIIECAGHNPHMEQPAAVQGLIRDFLAQPVNNGATECRQS